MSGATIGWVCQDSSPSKEKLSIGPRYLCRSVERDDEDGDSARVSSVSVLSLVPLSVFSFLLLLLSSPFLFFLAQFWQCSDGEDSRRDDSRPPPPGPDFCQDSLDLREGLRDIQASLANAAKLRQLAEQAAAKAKAKRLRFVRFSQRSQENWLCTKTAETWTD